MLRSLLCATLAFVGHLTAERIDNIEFQLPSLSQQWELYQTIDNAYGSARIFTTEEPEEEEIDYDPYDYDTYSSDTYEDDDAFHLFYATLHYVPYISHIDPQELEQQLALTFPFFQYQFYLVNQDADSALLEFYGFDEDGFVMYGIIRKMRSANGTVTLTYMIDEDDGITKVRKSCLNTLQAAKAIPVSQ